MIDYYVAVENNVLNLLYNVSSTYQSSATYELCKKKNPNKTGRQEQPSNENNNTWRDCG